jgi:hypothetical protein
MIYLCQTVHHYCGRQQQPRVCHVPHSNDGSSITTVVWDSIGGSIACCYIELHTIYTETFANLELCNAINLFRFVYIY